MNAQEFEEAVRELRKRQKRYFACRKDSPDKERCKQMMRQQEKLVGEVVDIIMATQPRYSKPVGERKAFFLDVAEMLRLQKVWIRSGGGGWMATPARELEAKVDKQLNIWDEQRKVEQEKKADEERKRQLKLF